MTFFAEQAGVTIYAPSSVKQGEGLLLECRFNHTLNNDSLTWELHISNKTFLYFNTSGGPKRCLKNKAWNWWAGNSNYLYLNSTQLSDSGKYTCSVKIRNVPLMMLRTQIVVYSEYMLFSCRRRLIFTRINPVVFVSSVSFNYESV